jgi:hypothetical protein
MHGSSGADLILTASNFSSTHTVVRLAIQTSIQKHYTQFNVRPLVRLRTARFVMGFTRGDY